MVQFYFNIIFIITITIITLGSSNFSTSYYNFYQTESLRLVRSNNSLNANKGNYQKLVKELNNCTKEVQLFHPKLINEITGSLDKFSQQGKITALKSLIEFINYLNSSEDFRKYDEPQLELGYIIKGNILPVIEIVDTAEEFKSFIATQIRLTKENVGFVTIAEPTVVAVKKVSKNIQDFKKGLKTLEQIALEWKGVRSEITGPFFVSLVSSLSNIANDMDEFLKGIVELKETVEYTTIDPKGLSDLCDCEAIIPFLDGISGLDKVTNNINEYLEGVDLLQDLYIQLNINDLNVARTFEYIHVPILSISDVRMMVGENRHETLVSILENRPFSFQPFKKVIEQALELAKNGEDPVKFLMDYIEPLP